VSERFVAGLGGPGAAASRQPAGQNESSEA
jgi:hypothetical protein